ncbi:hypothetical protein ACFE04_002446 [Oxalis oulophora]
METSKLTEYEQKRLENIKRNQQMIAALNIHSTLSQLSASTNKRQRVGKTFKVSPKKKSRSDETPVVIRRSLRTRGIAPESDGLRGDDVENSAPLKFSSPLKASPRQAGPLKMTDAFTGEGGYEKLIKVMVDVAKKPETGKSVEQLFEKVKACKEEAMSGLKMESTHFLRSAIKPCKDELSCDLEEDKRNVLNASNKNEFADIKPIKDEIVGVYKEENRESQSGSSLDLNSLTLKEENIARLVPGRIMTVKFLPSDDVRMIMVGNKFGDVAFWNMDSNNGEDADDNDGIFLYHPHTGPISGIVVQRPCLSKIFTSCYDGFLRLMDAEKEVFDLVYSCDDAIFSLAQRPNDTHTLYFAEGPGTINIWDVRTGKSSAELNLHDSRINTIDFSSTNKNIMATSSTDRTACLWDLRHMAADKPQALKTVNHKRAVHSAYFSPSGRSFATTSLDDTVGIVSGSNFDDTSIISHNNQTGRWLSKFKATWGWDDSSLFIGNMKRGVDIISPAQRRTIMTLESPLMTAIPCTFTTHPYHVGTLAGATSGGQVYVWTS